jgi:hypothetical protein
LGEVEKVVGPVGHREPPNRLVIPQFANIDAVKAWRQEVEATLSTPVCITQSAKHVAPGVAGSPSALNRGSAADLLL